MTGQDLNTRLESWKAFARKNRLLLIAGGVLLVLFAMNDEGQGTYSQPSAQPAGDPTVMPVDMGGGGGAGGDFDMDGWREDQRRGDIEQRDRIDAIREVERCYDPNTGETIEVSIHAGC